MIRRSLRRRPAARLRRRRSFRLWLLLRRRSRQVERLRGIRHNAGRRSFRQWLHVRLWRPRLALRLVLRRRLCRLWLLLEEL